MRRLPGILSLLVGTLAFGLAGCGGPDIEALCLATEDCVGGNDLDIEACVATYGYQQEVADIEGCTEEFDLFFECAEVTADCQTDESMIACAEKSDCTAVGYTSCSDGMCRRKFYGFEDADDCEVELAGYTACVGQ